MWGIFDTVDQVWMGGDDGPTTFPDEIIAKIAAQVLDVRLGMPPGRFRERPYDPGQKVRRDDVTPLMTTLEALRKVERGEV